MSRRSTAKRLAIGIPYLIVYAVALFWAVFLTAIVLGALDAGWRLLTGSDGTRLTTWSSTLWTWAGGNAQWSLTGDGEFRLLP